MKERYPDVPWREMSGIRDKLIHDYSGVSEIVVWKTAAQDLTDVKQKIKEIYKRIND
jgi:uncharacterized protein with HEPN domain